MSELFENFYDFEFKAQQNGQWDLEIEEEVWRKIGCKYFLTLSLMLMPSAKLYSSQIKFHPSQSRQFPLPHSERF